MRPRDAVWGMLVTMLLAIGPAWAEAPARTTESGRASDATKRKKTTRKKTAPKKAVKTPSARRTHKKASKKATRIPVDVALGPAFHWITGPIQDDQAPHYGLKLSVKAIIDQATIEANKGRIPKKYRAMARNVKEARISPSIFIPDTLYISPKTQNVGLYGINFRPFAFNIPLMSTPRLTVGLGLDLSYIYIDGETDDPETDLGVTHFLRPGLDLAAELEIPLSKTFLISAGWQSMFFPPQEIGGDILAWGELEDSIWHIGQAFVLLHFRFPYSVKL